jgi:hypothetical protein
MNEESQPSSLVQGTLHMLVLKTLTLEPLHGHGIGVRLEQISRGVFKAIGRRSTTRSPPPAAPSSNAAPASGKCRRPPSPGS